MKFKNPFGRPKGGVPGVGRPKGGVPGIGRPTGNAKRMGGRGLGTMAQLKKVFGGKRPKKGKMDNALKKIY